MGEVVSIITGQPIIQGGRITSASKPEIIAIQTDLEQECAWLKMHDWYVIAYADGVTAAARHIHFLLGSWMPYQEAVELQENVNMGRVVA